MSNPTRLIINGGKRSHRFGIFGDEMHISAFTPICGRMFDEIVIELAEFNTPVSEVLNRIPEFYLTRVRPGGRIVLNTLPTLPPLDRERAL